jgi:hypothetical protein
MSDVASNSIWLLAVPFAAIGGPVLATGLVLLARGISARSAGRWVEAEVVHRDVHRPPVAAQRAPDALAAATVTPHLRYRDADGRERIARLDHQTPQRLRSQRYRLRYPLGARVRVLIDPRRPDVASDGTIGSLFVFPGLLVVAGAVMSLLALGLVFG